MSLLMHSLCFYASICFLKSFYRFLIISRNVNLLKPLVTHKRIDSNRFVFNIKRFFHAVITIFFVKNTSTVTGQFFSFENPPLTTAKRTMQAIVPLIKNST
jgi:hypothetical protein